MWLGRVSIRLAWLSVGLACRRVACWPWWPFRGSGPGGVRWLRGSVGPQSPSACTGRCSSVPDDRRPAWPTVDVVKLREVKLGQLAARFAFGAVVSVGAGVLGKSVGARFGGTFLAFPAIL